MILFHNHIAKLGHLALQLALSGITEKLDAPLTPPPLVLQLLSCGFVSVLSSSALVFLVSDSPIILIIYVHFII